MRIGSHFFWSKYSDPSPFLWHKSQFLNETTEGINMTKRPCFVSGEMIRDCCNAIGDGLFTCGSFIRNGAAVPRAVLILDYGIERWMDAEIVSLSCEDDSHVAESGARLELDVGFHYVTNGIEGLTLGSRLDKLEGQLSCSRIPEEKKLTYVCRCKFKSGRLGTAH